MKLLKRIVRRKIKELEPVIVEKAVDKVAGRAVDTVKNGGLLGFLQRLTPRKLKAIAILGGCGIIAANIVGNIMRDQKMKLMFRRELRRQLKPMEEKIDDLEDQNTELRRQLKARA